MSAASSPATRKPRQVARRGVRPLALIPVLSGLLAGGGFVLTSAAPAAAHDDIVAATPEAGSTLGVVPQELTLTFSGEILTDASTVIIEVIGPDGRNVAGDAALIEGTTVTQSLAPEQGPGLYTVRWRVVSSDGHPIRDEYTYTIEFTMDPARSPSPEQSAPERTREPSSTPTPADGTASGGHGQPSGGGELLPLLAIVSVSIVTGGALAVVLMLGRERRRRDRAAVPSTRERAQGVRK